MQNIEEHFKRTEGDLQASSDYMSKQNEINESMRQVLIDWLIEVHFKFKMKAETLHIAINLLDRFLEGQTVLRSEFQLVGIVCLMIAAKYEEIFPPPVTDFVYIADYTYSKERFLAQELIILAKLDFGLNFPVSFTFLKQFLKKLGEDEFSFDYAQFILESGLLSV